MAARLDVRKMARDGLLITGATTTWRWSSGLLATMAVQETAIALDYLFEFIEGERRVQSHVRLERTPCQFGGSRVWFACPRCHRRVAILYLWGYPACRTCCRMAYPSQSDDAIDRSWRRTRKIEARLGGEWPVVRKPKWMRHATYERLWEACCREEEIRERAIQHFIETRMPGGF